MSHVHGTGPRGLMAIAVAVLLLGDSASTHAALTTPACLAKKLKEWGKLRNCQAKENAKALQGKPANPAKCQTKFDEKLAKLTAQATAAAIACRYGVNGDGTATDYDTGLVWEQKTDDGSVHDKDNTYTWNTTFGGTTPNGVHGVPGDAEQRDEPGWGGDHRLFCGALRLAAAGSRGVADDSPGAVSLRDEPVHRAFKRGKDVWSIGCVGSPCFREVRIKRFDLWNDRIDTTEVGIGSCREANCFADELKRIKGATMYVRDLGANESYWWQ